jgi:2-polyprenyl-6-methoxyphenol hydroxylase-like FAD-dependent oxidoreductase
VLVGVAVLERRGEKSNLSRAFAVHARTLEVMDMRGLAEEFTSEGAHVPELRLFGRDRVDLSGLPTRFPYLLVTPQSTTERLLRRWAVEAGADIRDGAEVTGVRQDRDGVYVSARSSAGEEAWRARFVVGADGAHSLVRHLVGLAFQDDPWSPR